ncbi:hypothetical protein ACERK3_13820 [Phycisphaerales bacterium AB-hyl4]|uniref:Uncharacterized protein n=1 Tax=Natronomicrosphaera hydrolytica TaxID=3242702 RepID=A0ABV4UAP1_9BACT
MPYDLNNIRHKLHHVRYNQYMAMSNRLHPSYNDEFILPFFDGLRITILPPSEVHDYPRAQVVFITNRVFKERIIDDRYDETYDANFRGGISGLQLWWSFKTDGRIRILCEVHFSIVTEYLFDIPISPVQRFEYHQNGYLTPHHGNDRYLLPDCAPYSKGYAFSYYPEWFIIPDVAALAHEALATHYASMLD